MQTFLPHKSFNESFKVLDYRRLGKQRVEAYQILNVLLGRTKTKGWVNHPATKMWKGYENALKQYLNECIEHWIARGYNNNMKKEIIEGKIEYPHWLGDDKFHSTHRSNLLRKDKEFYSKYLWTEADNMEYYWPVTN